MVNVLPDRYIPPCHTLRAPVRRSMTMILSAQPGVVFPRVSVVSAVTASFVPSGETAMLPPVPRPAIPAISPPLILVSGVAEPLLAMVRR